MAATHRRQLLPEPLGLGRQLDGEVPATAGQGQAGRLGPQRGGAPDQLAQGGGPTQVDVGVVLPGEPHAAQDLDGPLGRLHVAVEGQRRRPAGRPGDADGRVVGTRGRSGPASGRLVVQPRAASQVAATACSTATSMSASRCLTPWNWPMGRPNCWRVRACSAAVSRHQRAPPAASAESTTRAPVPDPPGGHPGQHPRGRNRHRPSQRHRADRRDGSKLGSGSTVTAGPRSSSTHRSRTVDGRPGPAPWHHGRPVRESGRRARRPTSVPSGARRAGQSGPGHGRAVGCRRRHHQRGRHGPVGQAGQQLLGQTGLADPATTAATTAVVAQGPGAAARPSSSATTASSTIPAPWPPNSSGRWMPRVPWAPSSAQKGGSASASASSAARVTPGGQRDSTQRRTDGPQLLVLVPDPDGHRSGPGGVARRIRTSRMPTWQGADRPRFGSRSRTVSTIPADP